MPARRLTRLIDENSATAEPVLRLPIETLTPHELPLRLYQDSAESLDALADSLNRHGQLTPIVVEPAGQGYAVLSGTRRLAAAQRLGWKSLNACVRCPADDAERELWVIESNHARTKTFSQRMREADALESLYADQARRRSLANLTRSAAPKLFVPDDAECRNSDTPEIGTKLADQGRKGRPKRTDTLVAKLVGLGGKDQFRQARAVWKAANDGNARAKAALSELDAGTKSIHAAFKDLRRQNHLANDFQPTPYDVWMFKHDRAYGTRYPGSIPAGIVANALHYFSEPGDLVVDPMAGGGTTIDVCSSMNRRCLAYDLAPNRPDIVLHDISRNSLPDEAADCDLIFLDPPYHSMLDGHYAVGSVSELTDEAWTTALERIYERCYAALRPGGVLAVLIANRTEKGLPSGWGYVDHAFESYRILTGLGFLPLRRISCPMEGAYRPDQINASRSGKRLLGQVRDLVVTRKPGG
ncbi:chromosome partitioning protein ParB [bacterium]|nr:chromosome partitioning protein ParB [bacterium]